MYPKVGRQPGSRKALVAFEGEMPMRLRLLHTPTRGKQRRRRYPPLTRMPVPGVHSLRHFLFAKRRTNNYTPGHLTQNHQLRHPAATVLAAGQAAAAVATGAAGGVLATGATVGGGAKRGMVVRVVRGHGAPLRLRRVGRRRRRRLAAGQPRCRGCAGPGCGAGGR